MTPTEQDKISDEELTKAIYEAMQVPYLSERHDAIMQLIIADRKRVALEARVDEIEHIAGFTHGMTNQMFKNLQNRIAGLKAQQEEVWLEQ